MVRVKFSAYSVAPAQQYRLLNGVLPLLHGRQVASYQGTSYY